MSARIHKTRPEPAELLIDLPTRLKERVEDEKLRSRDRTSSREELNEARRG